MKMHPESIKFLGELFKLDILSTDFIACCIKTLLCRGPDSLPCLASLLTCIHKKLYLPENMCVLSECLGELNIEALEEDITVYYRFLIHELTSMSDDKNQAYYCTLRNGPSNLGISTSSIPPLLISRVLNHRVAV